jgi:hypothetical protein
MAVMEINTYSNSTSSASNSYNYPLYIASYEHIKLQTPYILIGESDPADSPDIQMDPYNGALKLNRTGIQQTTVDEELVLYSTHGSDLTAGVALEGAYRLQVNNITIEDKGGSTAEVASQTPRYIYTEGSLRISTNQPGWDSNIPEVWIDGNVNSNGKAYFRVGSAVIRDGFVEDATITNAVTLIGVANSAAGANWAPTTADAYDAVPPGLSHSGNIIIRSEAEVRICAASTLPQISTMAVLLFLHLLPGWCLFPECCKFAR